MKHLPTMLLLVVFTWDLFEKKVSMKLEIAQCLFYIVLYSVFYSFIAYLMVLIWHLTKGWVDVAEEETRNSL